VFGGAGYGSFQSGGSTSVSNSWPSHDVVREKLKKLACRRGPPRNAKPYSFLGRGSSYIYVNDNLAQWHSIADRFGRSCATPLSELSTYGGLTMSWGDQVIAKWHQIRGSVKQEWGKLTDDDLDYIEGTRDRLVSRLQQKYGVTKEEAEQQADRWFATQKNPAA